MSLLAVSIGFALAGSRASGMPPAHQFQPVAVGQAGPVAMPKLAHSAWETVKPSVAFILRNGIPSGQAALIDKSGLFLADEGAVTSQSVQARLSDGRVIVLDWKSTDLPTQTVLLQAEDWSPTDGMVVSLRAPGERTAKLPVIVVLPGGPVYGYLADGNRVGYHKDSKRSFPLGEVRFEANTQPVAGALVFDEGGRLVGLLNATLESEPSGFVHIAGPQSGTIPPLGLGGGGLRGGSQGGAGGQSQAGGDAKARQAQGVELQNVSGPNDPTIGYTVGPEVLRRIVSGFLSPNHKVLHPAIGVQCRYSNQAPGAVILVVKPDSPAEHAGILVGDLIVRMDDKPIRNQFDFSRVIESKDVGDTLTIGILRDNVPHTFKLVVGTIQKALMAPDYAVGE